MRSLPINDALLVLDQWLINLKEHPEKGVVGNRPVTANDRCYDTDLNVIDSGEDTWNGTWNGKALGACQSRFPHHSHSRLVAGDNIYTDTLKCSRVPVAQAIRQGLYGEVDMRPYKKELERIFPSGVCQFNNKPNTQVSQLIQKIKRANKG